jgi:hypothetical protein
MVKLIARDKHLFKNLSLMRSETGDFVWAEFHEIEQYYKDGYVLYNGLKRSTFEKALIKKTGKPVNKPSRKLTYTRENGIDFKNL